jgi:DUF971 family protein
MSPSSKVPAEPLSISISKSKGVKIDWKDGHHSEYSAAYLRDECPCATCTGAHGTVPEKTNYAAGEAASPDGLFPMFKPAIKMQDVEQIGNYAIKIKWSDGHSTGIYSFDVFRRICPCDVCKSERALAGLEAIRGTGDE